eukprot:RCo028788
MRESQQLHRIYTEGPLEVEPGRPAPSSSGTSSTTSPSSLSPPLAGLPLPPSAPEGLEYTSEPSSSSSTREEPREEGWCCPIVLSPSASTVGWGGPEAYSSSIISEVSTLKLGERCEHRPAVESRLYLRRAEGRGSSSSSTSSAAGGAG